MSSLLRTAGSLRSCGFGLGRSALTVVPQRFMSAGPAPLSQTEIEKRVLDVVRKFVEETKKTDVARVTPAAHFIKDLGLDSLDTVEIVNAFEEEFALDIPDQDADKIFTAKDAIQYVAKKQH